MVAAWLVEWKFRLACAYVSPVNSRYIAILSIGNYDI
jgi:hypothetical protein